MLESSQLGSLARSRAARARCAVSFFAFRAGAGNTSPPSRKLAILIWHLLTKNENYLWARPALHARKLRDLELKAGHRAARGQKGTAHA